MTPEDNTFALQPDTPDDTDPHQPAPPPMCVLEPAYDHALIGHMVHPTQPPRFAYSLTAILRHHTFATAESGTSAELSVWNMVKDITSQHGDRAPLFVDDRVSVERRESVIVNPNEKKIIVLP